MQILKSCHYACIVILLLFVAGCSPGERAVQVQGRVTNAGQPLQVAGREIGLGMVQLQFFRTDEHGRAEGDSEGAVADSEGRFQVHGRNGKGIPPGKYRIAIRQWDPYPQVDKLDGRFSADKSTIVREINGNQEILIDVARPEG